MSEIKFDSTTSNVVLPWVSTRYNGSSTCHRLLAQYGGDEGYALEHLRMRDWIAYSMRRLMELNRDMLAGITSLILAKVTMTQITLKIFDQRSCSSGSISYKQWLATWR